MENHIIGILVGYIESPQHKVLIIYFMWRRYIEPALPTATMEHVDVTAYHETYMGYCLTLTPPILFMNYIVKATFDGLMSYQHA